MKTLQLGLGACYAFSTATVTHGQNPWMFARNRLADCSSVQMLDSPV
jgi:hypothetical protein